MATLMLMQIYLKQNWDPTSQKKISFLVKWIRLSVMQLENAGLRLPIL